MKVVRIFQASGEPPILTIFPKDEDSEARRTGDRVGRAFHAVVLVHVLMMFAKVKAEQLKATNATVLATACENCHSQLTDVNEHYRLGMDVQFISGLVADALVNTSAFSKKKQGILMAMAASR